jgi:hypothetical protein
VATEGILKIGTEEGATVVVPLRMEKIPTYLGHPRGLCGGEGMDSAVIGQTLEANAGAKARTLAGRTLAAHVQLAQQRKPIGSQYLQALALLRLYPQKMVIGVEGNWVSLRYPVNADQKQHGDEC